MFRRATTPLVGLLLVLGILGVAHASDPVVIVSPVEGDVVTSPVKVEVTFGLVTVCHEDGNSGETCEDHPPMRGELYVRFPNDELALWVCEACEGTETVFTVELPVGANGLRAAARFSPAEELSEFVHIVVEGTSSGSSGTGSTSTTGTSDTETTAGTVASDPTTVSGTSFESAGSTSLDGATSGGKSTQIDGCACTETEHHSLTWLAFVFLVAPRRRCRALVLVALGMVPSCSPTPAEKPPFPVLYETEHLRIGTSFEPGLCAGNLGLWEAQMEVVGRELGVAGDSIWLFLYADEQTPLLTRDCEVPAELGELSGCWDAPVARATIPTASHEIVHAMLDDVNDDPLPFLREGIAVRMEGNALRGNYGREQAYEELLESEVGPGSYSRAGHFVEWLIAVQGSERFLQLYRRLRRGASSAEVSQTFVDVIGESHDEVVADYVATAKDYYPGVGPFACGRGEPVVWEGQKASWRGESSCKAESIFAVVGRPDRSAWGQRWRIEIETSGLYLLDTSGHHAALRRCLDAPADAAELTSSGGPVIDEWLEETSLEALRAAQDPSEFAAPLTLPAGTYELWVRYIPESSLQTSLDMSLTRF